jgi:6-phosphogluconolactonase
MAKRGELQIYRDSAALAQAVADLVVAQGRMAMSDDGDFTIALSGGNTPRAAYELLGREPLRSELSWSDVFVYFGDERCVPPTDVQSNYRMARKAFLDDVGISPENVHRIRGEIDPGQAANEYAALLRTAFGGVPHFDLMLLGLGSDGHTASLFPGSPPDTDDAALVRAVYSEPAAMWRVTVTPEVINAAKTVVFAVQGVDKAQILCDVYEGPIDTVRYPAQAVVPASGRLIWMVDELAAGMLKSRA